MAQTTPSNSLPRKTIIEEVLYFTFLAPIVLFFILNPFTSDIVSHKIDVRGFFLIYVSLASAVILTSYHLWGGRRIRWDWGMTLLCMLTCIFLLSTVVFQTIPEQVDLRRILKLLAILGASISSYLIGTQFFSQGSRVTAVISLLISLGMVWGLAQVLQHQYLFQARGYGWSNIMLPFFLYWLAKVDNQLRWWMRATVAIPVLVTSVMSGTRTVLGWILFWTAMGSPTQVVKRMALFGALAAMIAYLYFNTNALTGSEGLLNRYEHSLDTGRSTIWKAAVSRIEKQDLLLGGGFFDYPLVRTETGTITTAHNSYLHLVLSGGIIGLLCGVVLMAYFIFKHIRTAPGIVLFLPILAIVAEIPLFPWSFSRVFENMTFYFVMGLLGNESKPQSQISSIHLPEAVVSWK
ncbi:MAG: hypothetical protein Q8N04_09860 [Nitrospira sp.]|nr:hypothetical protein [Nitrospira sp.]